MSAYAMAAKQIMPNQCVPLHFIYGKNDCCLCNSRVEAQKLQQNLYDIRAELFNISKHLEYGALSNVEASKEIMKIVQRID